MSDVAEVKEALDQIKVAANHAIAILPFTKQAIGTKGEESIRLVVDAARRWVRMVSEGERVEWCEPHRNEAWEDYQGDDDDNPVFNGYRCAAGAWIEGANAWDCRIVPVLVVRIDGET